MKNFVVITAITLALVVGAVASAQDSSLIPPTITKFLPAGPAPLPQQNSESASGGSAGGDPAPQSCKGDMNHDGRTNNFDIDLYVYVHDLTSFLAASPWYWAADMNEDGTLDQADEDLFVDAINNADTLDCTEQACHGDVNGDDRVNNFDIDLFRFVADQWQMNSRSPLYWYADMDDNDLINEADIDLFVDVINQTVAPLCRRG